MHSATKIYFPVTSMHANLVRGPKLYEAFSFIDEAAFLVKYVTLCWNMVLVKIGILVRKI